MTRYQFDNLADEKPSSQQAFRLFKLDPGRGEAEITGRLLTCKLGDPPARLAAEDWLPRSESYEAISWTWGPAARDDPEVGIQHNGHRYTIPIRKNLSAALMSLRYPDNTRTLWVDALCIDHENELEKAIQISNMYRIYGGASCVRVWLGSSCDSSTRAFRFIEQCRDPDTFDKMLYDTKAAKSWDAVASLMKKDWFSRRWIVQEIALAPEARLHCGDQNIAWRDFVEVVSQMSDNQEELRDLFKRSTEFHNHPDYLGDLSELGAIRLVDTHDNLFRELADGRIERKLSLEALMSTMTVFESSNPRDIVYAILWLAKDVHMVVNPKTRAPEHQPPPLINEPGHHDYPREDGADGPLLTNSPIREESEQGASPMNERSFSDSMHGNHSQANSVPVSPTTEVSASGRPESSSGNWNLYTRINHDRATHLSPTSANMSRSGRPRTLSNLSVPADPMEREKFWANQFRRRILWSRFTLDYNKSLFEVCRDFIKFAMEHSSSLDVLCRPWAPEDPKDPDFPSWILPLRKNAAFRRDGSNRLSRVNADPLVGRLEPGGNTYNAAKAFFAEFVFHKGTNRARSLSVRGFVLSRLQQSNIQPVAMSGTVPCEWRDAVAWRGKEHPPNSFWRTLVGDRNSNGRVPRVYWGSACAEAFNLGPDDADFNTMEAIHKAPKRAKAFLRRAQSVIWNRRFANITDVRSLSHSLVPKETKGGDLVCILYGCSVPIVLRPRAIRRDGEVHECYEFIGECYVHGVMEGEAIDIAREVREKRKQSHDRDSYGRDDMVFKEPGSRKRVAANPEPEMRDQMFELI
jgi:hypothetical protein